MLSEEQAQKLRQTVNSGGWLEVMRPAIANRGHSAIKALVLPKEKREGEFKEMSDEYLRARIEECEFALNVWNNELVVYEHNRRLDELAPAVNGENPQ